MEHQPQAIHISNERLEEQEKKTESYPPDSLSTSLWPRKSYLLDSIHHARPIYPSQRDAGPFPAVFV